MAETKDLNIEVKGMPVHEDRILNMLALMRGVTKSQVMRDALVEYARGHIHEIRDGFTESRSRKGHTSGV